MRSARPGLSDLGPGTRRRPGICQDLGPGTRWQLPGTGQAPAMGSRPWDRGARISDLGPGTGRAPASCRPGICHRGSRTRCQGSRTRGRHSFCIQARALARSFHWPVPDLLISLSFEGAQGPSRHFKSKALALVSPFSSKSGSRCRRDSSCGGPDRSTRWIDQVDQAARPGGSTR